MAADMCIVGHVTWDVTRTAEGRTLRQPGGTAFYAGVAAARLGAAAEVVTRLAPADEAPLSAELRSAGARVTVLPDSATTTFENRYGKDDDDRRQWIHDRAAPMAPADLAERSPGAWLLGPLEPTDVPPALVPRAPGPLVALDLQGWLRRVESGGRVVTGTPNPEAVSALRHVRVLKASEAEARIVTGQRTPAAMAAALRSLGPAEVLVTLGARGSVVSTLEGTIRVRALAPDRLVDPTGCGDTFLAAYLVARLSGHPPVDAARLATAAASRVAEQPGPLRASADELHRRAQRVRVERVDRVR